MDRSAVRAWSRSVLQGPRARDRCPARALSALEAPGPARPVERCRGGGTAAERAAAARPRARRRVRSSAPLDYTSPMNPAGPMVRQNRWDERPPQRLRSMTNTVKTALLLGAMSGLFLFL